MPKGGARSNSGRKPTPLAEKLAKGNPGKRPLKKVEFAKTTYDPTKPPRYLEMLAKKHGDFLVSPLEIYEEAMEYLEPSGCLHLIPKTLIREYVMANFYAVQAHYELSTSSNVGIDNKGAVVITGFAKFMQDQQKQVLFIWDKIWDIVSRNSERVLDNPEHELLSLILGGRVRNKTGG
jgi:hypothetical protein